MPALPDQRSAPDDDTTSPGVGPEPTAEPVDPVKAAMNAALAVIVDHGGPDVDRGQAADILRLWRFKDSLSEGQRAAVAAMFPATPTHLLRVTVLPAVAPDAVNGQPGQPLTTADFLRLVRDSLHFHYNLTTAMPDDEAAVDATDMYMRILGLTPKAPEGAV